MKKKEITARHIEWLSADEMHSESKKWLSTLEYYKDEQLFFEDLIRTYTLQIIENNHFEDSKKLIDKLTLIVKQTQSLIDLVKSHEKGLSIMVDGIDEIKEEKVYRKEHKNMAQLIEEFEKRYQSLKSKLFSLVKLVMKESKQKRIIDKN